MPKFGGYTDIVVVPARQAIKMPDKMTFEEGAALPVVYVTAHNMMLFTGNLRPGSNVLIHSAAGGVGLAAIQIAKTRECVILGTASASKHAFLGAGVPRTPSTSSADYAAAVRAVVGDKGVDLVLDPVGGKSWNDGLRPARRRAGASSRSASRRRPRATRATSLTR